MQPVLAVLIDINDNLGNLINQFEMHSEQSPLFARFSSCHTHGRSCILAPHYKNIKVSSYFFELICFDTLSVFSTIVPHSRSSSERPFDIHTEAFALEH